MLTDRELAIAERYAQGESHKQIARALFIAPSTVRNHLAAIYRKLGVSSKIALVSALPDETSRRAVLVQPESGARSSRVLKMLTEDELPPVSGPSIAVMPFTAVGGRLEQVVLGQGIAEDVHTDLTRFQELFVVGRSSCMTMSQQTNDAKEIARKLGVQYVLQGTVRRRNKALRITVELVDGGSARALWSEQYDRVLDDLFEIESDVAHTITRMLALRIEDAQYELCKDTTPEKLSAYEWQIRGNRCLNLGGRDDLASAIDCFSRAQALDPESASPVAGLSLCYGYACWDLLADDYSGSLNLHRRLAERAVALDERNSRGHYALCCTHHLTGRLELADLHAARAVELNPSECHNICARGYTLLWLDQVEESLECFVQSLRRNPLAPNSCLMALGLYEYTEGNYAQASLVLSRLTAEHLRRVSTLAAAYAQLGYAEAASAEVQRFRDLVADRPGAPVGQDRREWRSFWRTLYPFVRRENLDHLLEGLTNAGLPT